MKRDTFTSFNFRRTGHNTIDRMKYFLVILLSVSMTHATARAAEIQPAPSVEVDHRNHPPQPADSQDHATLLYLSQPGSSRLGDYGGPRPRLQNR